MSREDNVEIVRRSFDFFETADMDAWTADWADDIVFEVGAYAPGPKDERVGEEWPVTGVPGSTSASSSLLRWQLPTRSGSSAVTSPWKRGSNRKGCATMRTSRSSALRLSRPRSACNY